MLILTRKPGQSIMIGNDIKVMVSVDKHGNIKVGVDAPRDIAIYREEIYKKINAAD